MGINSTTNLLGRTEPGLELQLCADQWEGGTRTGPRDTGGQACQSGWDWPRLSGLRDAGPTRADVTTEMRAGERKGQKEESS